MPGGIMDFMLILQIVVLLGAIFLGVRLGGIGIGYAGGLGVLVLGLLLGMKPGNIPWDVILIIASVIAAISCMQLAGGLDYLVQIAERILRSNPKQINYLAPVVTYVLTIFAGTGHTAFSMIPVIVEVAKEQKIRPCCPLSIAVVASQIAITASPVSAAVIYMSGVLEPFGWSYPGSARHLAPDDLRRLHAHRLRDDEYPEHGSRVRSGLQGTSRQGSREGLLRRCPDGAQALCQALRADLPPRRYLRCSLRFRDFACCRPHQERYRSA